jgi:mannosyltransferase OCH1-like enzyme
VIPKTFHRVWLDEPVPDRFEAYWDRFRDLHPDWELRTWDDSGGLDWLRCPSEFSSAKTWAGKSDVLRYELLYEFGGVYVDTDVEPLRPFDELLEDDRPFIGWEDGNLLCPTVMGAPPKHPAIWKLLQELPRWFHKYERMPPNRQTGPYFVTRFLRGRADVRQLDPAAFYPVGWWEKARLGGPYPNESYAVHHWAAGWLPDGPPQHIH